MKQPQPYRPIKCTNCGKKIAEGSLPALVEIKCPGCGVRNDLAAVAIDGDKRKPFAERLQLEKKREAIDIDTSKNSRLYGK